MRPAVYGGGRSLTRYRVDPSRSQLHVGHVRPKSHWLRSLQTPTPHTWGIQSSLSMDNYMGGDDFGKDGKFDVEELRHNIGRRAGKEGAALQLRFNNLMQTASSIQEQVWNNGMTCMHLNCFLFAIATLFVKLVSDHIPTFQIMLFRCVLSIGLNVAASKKLRLEPMWGHKRHWVLLGLRGFLGMLSMTTMYFAVNNMPMPDAVTIVFTNPAVTALLAWVMLKEHFGWRTGAGCVLSLVGVVLVARPPFLFGDTGTVYGVQQLFAITCALLSSLATALSFVCVRVIGMREPSLVIALWQLSISLIFSAVPLMLGWPNPAVMPTAMEWILLTLIGVMTFVSQVLTNRAFQLEPAGKVASINLMQVLYSYMFELAIFKAPVTLLSTLGSMLVAGGVLVVNFKSMVLQKEAHPRTV